MLFLNVDMIFGSLNVSQLGGAMMVVSHCRLSSVSSLKKKERKKKKKVKPAQNVKCIVF